MTNPDVPRLTPERRAEIEYTVAQLCGWESGIILAGRLPNDPGGRLALHALLRHDVPDLLRELAAVEAERDSARMLYQSSQEALTEVIGELRECREEAEAVRRAAKAAASLLRGEREAEHDLVLHSPVRVRRVLRQLETALGEPHDPPIAEWETKEQ